MFLLDEVLHGVFVVFVALSLLLGSVDAWLDMTIMEQHIEVGLIVLIHM